MELGLGLRVRVRLRVGVGVRVEAVVRLVRRDEGGDAGVDRKVLLVVAVRGGEDRSAIDEHVVQLVAQDVLVRVRGRGTGRGRGRGRCMTLPES